MPDSAPTSHPGHAELARLTAEVVELERQRDRLLARFAAAEQRWRHVVAPARAELDRLRAVVADAKAAVRDGPGGAAQPAEGDEPTAAGGGGGAPRPRPVGGVTDAELWRQVVKALHPDLAEDERDRVDREEWMRRAVALRERGDGALRRLMAAWQDRPEAVRGDDPGAALERLARQVAAARARRDELVEELGWLRRHPLHELLGEVDVDTAVARVASRLERQSARLREAILAL